MMTITSVGSRGGSTRPQVYSGGDDLLGQTDTGWDNMEIGGADFAHVTRTVTTDFSVDPAISTRVDYEYDDDYGNVSAEYHYGAVEPGTHENTAAYQGDERSVHRVFYPNADHSVWIVNKVARASIYEGIRADDNNLDYLKSRTRYRYDDQSCWDLAPIDKGELTAVDRWKGTTGGSSGNCYADDYYITTYDYDDDWGNLTSETDPNAHTTETTYDPVYDLYPVETCNHLDHCVTTEYYGAGEDHGLPGQVKTVTDPNNAVTEYWYDDFGRLTHVWRPGDASGASKPPSRLIQYSDAVAPDWSPFVAITWDKTGYDASWSDFWDGTKSVAVCQFYDGLGRPVETLTRGADWTPGGGTNEHEIVQYALYDALGRATTQSVPYEVNRHASGTNPYSPPDLNQPHTSTQYDELGRVVKVENPDGTDTYRRYVNVGGFLWDSAYDENQHARSSVYDAFGQLVQVHEYEGNCKNTSVPPLYQDLVCDSEHNVPYTLYASTDYDYDVLGNLTQVTDDENNVTAMEYDALSRKETMDDPDMGAWDYAYDPAGNLIVQDDAKHQRICFYYDELNRLKGKRYTNDSTSCPSSPTTYDVSYSYDQGTYGEGRRTGMDDDSGNTTWTYDERGRVTQESKVIDGAGPFVTGYTYDAMDRVVTMVYPDGEIVTNSYNPRGLPKSLSGSSVYVSGTDYDAAGRVELRTLGNDRRTEYVYYPWTTANGMGRVQYIKTGTVSSPMSLQYMYYVYDAAGNVLTITDYGAGYPAQIQSFSYDSLDRLLSANASGGSGGTYYRTYQYDVIGNLEFKSDLGSYDYDAPKPPSGCTAETQATKPHAVEEAGSNSYGYDCNGNMTTRTEGSNIFMQEFDAENRLTSVSGALVTGKLAGVSSSWQTVELPNTYDSMVVVAAPNYDKYDKPAVVRIRNASGNSFQIKVQNPSAQSLSGYTVHYLVVEEGVYTQAQHGIKMEAKKYTSTRTDHNSSWVGQSRGYQQSYSNPVVLGQVMTANDGDWSVFWARGSSRSNPPTGSYLYAGKHVGEDGDTTRANETIGYVVIEAGSGSMGGVDYVAGLGADTVGGVGNAPPYNYTIGGPSSAGVAVVSAAAMDGSDGGWPVLYGSGPVNSSQLKLAVDEDQISDSERGHTTEQVAYILFAGSGTTEFIYDGDGNRVKREDSSGATVYVGGYYEKNNGGAGLGATPLRNGIACRDNATGSGYLLYSAESVHSRFAAHPPHGNNADHFICVVYSSGWKYDNNSSLYAFTPRSTDILVAAVNFGADTVSSLEGQNSTQYGIAYGYASGDLTFEANKWNGVYNLGEFSISGSTLTPNDSWAMITKTYYAGGARVAMNRDGVVYYLLSDHLGSTAITINSDGTSEVGELRYYAYGKTRYSSGATPTDRRFTGQIEDATIGLYFYNARYYDAALGRFVSADTIVPDPGNPQDLNRYSYVRNNPVLYMDPSGHNPILGLMLIAAGVAALAVEVPQISSYAEHHDMSFWEAAVDPDLYLDQAAMADAAVRGAFTTLVAAQSVPLALAGGGAMLAEYGMRTDNVGAWETAAALNNAAAGVDAWLWGVGESVGHTGETERTSGETKHTIRGRQAHQAWDPGPGFEKEVALPSGLRADAVNWEQQIVIELKPNNPRKIAEGWRQVRLYLSELSELQDWPQPYWTALVETYDK